jgi:hypothetical protein
MQRFGKKNKMYSYEYCRKMFAIVKQLNTILILEMMSLLIVGKGKPEFDRKINMLIEIAAGFVSVGEANR